jgi:mRNA-degrading endonuclease RelE of RelBE toxin-antitoxin system
MSSDPVGSIRVAFTPEFKRNLRQLAKKYRHIKSDLQPILDQLVNGGKPGDQVPGVRFEVFKVRAKNSDAGKGKSGGYRLIYLVKCASERILVTVYSKTEQADIAADKIRQIILDLEPTGTPDAPREQDVNSGEPERTD